MASHIWRNPKGDADVYFTSDDESEYVEIALPVFRALLRSAGWRPLTEEELGRLREPLLAPGEGLRRLREVST